MIHLRLFCLSISLLFACLYPASQAIAGVAVVKSVPIEKLAEAPQNLTFYIYKYKDDSEPTLVQQFGPGEWQLNGNIDENTDTLRFQVTLNDLEQFSGDKVWVQMAVDGVLTAGLTPLVTIEPGISVEGFVESRVLGFKFPDGTTQITAADGDNLGNHIATQNIQLGSFWLSGDADNEGIQVDTSGKVGVAAAPGSANFQVAGTDGVLFSGTLDEGSIPASGAGTRMMWYPKKAAFRAGGTSSSQWDVANIGRFSTAMGASPTASGDYSTAMGASTTASNDFSTAMGFATIASGNSSNAMGRYTLARSYAETVIGAYNTDYTPLSTSSWEASDRLFVIGNGPDLGNRSDALTVLKNGKVILNGFLQLSQLSAAGSIDLCRNPFNLVAQCSSSGRYKDNIQPLELGLETVHKLQPVMFDWKTNGQHDLGFVAEDVAAIDPLLVVYNDSGEIEGVKYKQLTAVLVNAIQSQQSQYASLQAQNTTLQAEVATLRKQQQHYARMVMEIKQQLEQRPLLTSLNLN